MTSNNNLHVEEFNDGDSAAIYNADEDRLSLAGMKSPIRFESDELQRLLDFIEEHR